MRELRHGQKPIAMTKQAKGGVKNGVVSVAPNCALLIWEIPSDEGDVVLTL
jgi:hypothetical protein